MEREQSADFALDDAALRVRDARRHPVAFVASIAAHALILAALVFFLPQVERPHQWVLAYLVDFGQSGGGAGRGAVGGDAAVGPSPAAVHAAALAAMPQKPPHAHRRAAHAQAAPERAVPQPAAIAATPVAGDAAIAARSEAADPPAAGTATSAISVASATSFGSGAGDGGGGGRGSGGFGDGSGSFAHVAYGHNPAPIYPVEARRRAQHGTVLLRIKVAVDGAVEMVEVAQSSGFDLLDDEALATVRTRWRFVPARRDGVAVESWCEVPIRFALTEAESN